MTTRRNLEDPITAGVYYLIEEAAQCDDCSSWGFETMGVRPTAFKPKGV